MYLRFYFILLYMNKMKLIQIILVILGIIVFISILWGNECTCEQMTINDPTLVELEIHYKNGNKEYIEKKMINLENRSDVSIKKRRYNIEKIYVGFLKDSKNYINFKNLILEGYPHIGRPSIESIREDNPEESNPLNSLKYDVQFKDANDNTYSLKEYLNNDKSSSHTKLEDRILLEKIPTENNMKKLNLDRFKIVRNN